MHLNPLRSSRLSAPHAHAAFLAVCTVICATSVLASPVQAICGVCCEDECGSSSSVFSDSSSSFSGQGNEQQAEPPSASGGDRQTDPGNGSHRGHDTNRILAGIAQIAFNLGLRPGQTPPAGFGGGNDVPLSDQEISFICSVQRSLPQDTDGELIAMAADMLSLIMGRAEAVMEYQLTNPALCADINALLRPQVVALFHIPRPVVLAEDGYPFSPSNPTWNKCVRGTATLEDIKNNTDAITTRSGKVIPKDCGFYKYTGTASWKYPDDPYLTLTIKDSPLGTSHAPTVTASAGYTVVKPTAPVATK